MYHSLYRVAHVTVTGLAGPLCKKRSFPELGEPERYWAVSGSATHSLCAPAGPSLPWGLSLLMCKGLRSLLVGSFQRSHSRML